MVNLPRILALLLFAVLAGGASAQTMYRCGSTFQDRACDKDVAEQRVVPGGGRFGAGAANSPSAATASSPFAAQCVRSGEHAQRISWKREGGATMDKQVKESAGNRELVAIIEQVYARRGTAVEIRAAVEADCVAERQRAADASEMLKALQKQAAPGTPAAVPVTADATATPTALADAPKRPNPRCTSLKSNRNYVESRLRDGGPVATMEHWQNERRNVDKQLSEANC